MRLFFFASILLLFSCHRSLFTTNVAKANQLTEPKQEDNGKIELTRTPVLAGQQPVLEGIVLDEQKIPFPFATVLILQKGVTIFGYTTDVDGHFIFKNLKPGEYQIEVRNIGYESQRKTFKITAHENINFECQFFPIQVIELKPVIYLYPENNCPVHVTLNYDGTLQHTYPKYPEGGWHVMAQPDGTLYDTNGQEYYALFWEGKPNECSVIESGFVIPGNETMAFLEEKLAQLGLNRREANEFIMFWLPQLEDNPYNLIHFAGVDYTQHAELIIEPQPQTIIRVMMYTSPLQTPIEFPTQDLSTMPLKREGFTVVEWGGTVVGFPAR